VDGATRIIVGGLNVAASPHGPGVYETVLNAVVDTPIAIGGHDMAKITKPSLRIVDSRSILFGQILVWTEIDKAGPWLNTEKNAEATEADKSQVFLPPNVKPNYRSFYYGFDENQHILLVEQNNERRQSFGPRRSEKFFRQLLQNPPGMEATIFSVTTIPEDDAVENILSLNRLRKLTITILRPNPGEDLFDEEAEILKQIEAEHAKSLTLEYIKAAGVAALTPTGRTRRLAQIASRNGVVQGEGKDESGTKLVESTDRHPKQVSYVVGPDSSAEIQFLNRLRIFESMAKSDKNNK
jgi:hypothetical protein